jgi:integrase
MTDEQIIAAYIDHQRVRGFSRRTVARRQWSLERWQRHVGDLAAATVGDVETFLAGFPAAQSRYSIRSDLRLLYRFATARGWLPGDPTELLPAPRVPRRASTPIPAGDVRALLAGLAGVDRVAVMLAACAGLRVSEIAGVRGEHVDLVGRWLTVRGKGGGDDVVPLSAGLVAELARLPRHGRVLPWSSGATVSARIRTLLRRHGVAGRPHDLRHSFANAAAAATNDPRTVQRLMRHAELTTTTRYLRPVDVGHDVVDRLYRPAA